MRSRFSAVRRRIENSAFEILEAAPGIYDCYFGVHRIATIDADDARYAAVCKVAQNEASRDEQEAVARILARETIRHIFTFCAREPSARP